MNPDEQPSAPDPNRRRLIVVFSGLALLGMVIGVSASQLVGSGNDSALLGASAASPPPPSPDPTDLPTDEITATPTDTGLPTPSPTDTTTPTATPTPTATGIPNYQPIPADPSTEPGLDFGYLSRVVRQDGTVTLVFDRATFYSGTEAQEQSQGQVLDNGHWIENTNPAQRSFPIDPQASIQAEHRLRNDPDQLGRQLLTLEQFVLNATRVLTESTTVLGVWLRHTGGLDGPVTAVAEQYLP